MAKVKNDSPDQANLTMSPGRHSGQQKDQDSPLVHFHRFWHQRKVSKNLVIVL
jgi:hypothetical protein